MGEGRLGFLDLSAGPFSWGPVVGGEGVRTAASFPDSHDLLAASPAAVGEGDDAGGGEHLQARAADMRGALEAGGGPPSALQLQPELAVLRKVLVSACDEEDEGRDLPHCEALAVRLRLLSAYARAADADAHAHANVVPSSRDAATRALGGAGGAELLARRRWEELQEELRGAGAEGEAAAISGAFQADGSVQPAVSKFFARLGGALDSAVRHAVTPASAPLAPRAHVAGRLHFNIFRLTQSRADGAEAAGARGLDVEALKAALARLALPSQAVAFTVHNLLLGDDPALAAAYARARTGAVVPVLRVDGTFAAEERVFLDSHTLSRQLRQGFAACCRCTSPSRRRTAARPPTGCGPSAPARSRTPPAPPASARCSSTHARARSWPRRWTTPSPSWTASCARCARPSSRAPRSPLRAFRARPRAGPPPRSRECGRCSASSPSSPASSHWPRHTRRWPSSTRQWAQCAGRRSRRSTRPSRTGAPASTRARSAPRRTRWALGCSHCSC
ncbi:hypothetical protein T492DRAFT_915279 [Pavlovales sp. CCMP2436]|nr:hypothetical protein T492DRAFT_915279 [Pavlovales sp. CCMP2436]